MGGITKEKGDPKVDVAILRHADSSARAHSCCSFSCRCRDGRALGIVVFEEGPVSMTFRVPDIGVYGRSSRLRGLGPWGRLGPFRSLRSPPGWLEYRSKSIVAYDAMPWID